MLVLWAKSNEAHTHTTYTNVCFLCAFLSKKSHFDDKIKRLRISNELSHLFYCSRPTFMLFGVIIAIVVGRQIVKALFLLFS